MFNNLLTKRTEELKYKLKAISNLTFWGFPHLGKKTCLCINGINKFHLLFTKANVPINHLKQNNLFVRKHFKCLGFKTFRETIDTSFEAAAKLAINPIKP